MVDWNLVLTIVALALAVAGGLIGVNGKTKLSELIGKTKLTTDKVINGFNAVSNIVTQVKAILTVVDKIVSDEVFEQEDIDALKNAVFDIKADAEVIIGIVRELMSIFQNA